MKQKHLRKQKIRDKNNQKKVWKEIDEQEKLERLKIKIETEKLKKENTIEGHEIRIELIKDKKKKRNNRAKNGRN